jgi:hypothetical protein
MMRLKVVVERRALVCCSRVLTFKGCSGKVLENVNRKGSSAGSRSHSHLDEAS